MSIWAANLQALTTIPDDHGSQSVGCSPLTDVRTSAHMDGDAGFVVRID